MIKTISASSINTYNACPLQWKYNYIYKLLQPDNPAFIIGTAYHKALEIWHSRSPEEPSYANQEAQHRIIEYLKKELMPNRTKEEIARFGIVRQMFECYQVNPAEGETQKVEYRFYVSLTELLGDKIGLIGYIDRITPTSIIDYKTSSEDFTEEKVLENIQTDIYSYVMWKERNELPFVTYHIMNKKKVGKNNYKPQIITVKRSVENMKQLESKLKEFHDNIINERFEHIKGNHCFWCSFRQNCPYK